MPSGNDARLGMAVESTYGTRVAPTRFFPFTAESLAYTFNKYRSRALGTGRWTAKEITTTMAGEGAVEGEVTTTGMGFLLNLLHGNVVTPVQQAATTAYLQTHTLDTAPSKSVTIQSQTPPVNAVSLVPHDLLGCMARGLSLSWDEVLTFSLPFAIQGLDIAQSLATYAAPTNWNLFSFRQGQLKIGGATVADIIGGGTLDIAFEQRTDAHYFGGSGKMAKPIESGKPTAGGSVTVDFSDNTHLNRTINETIADVVLLFEGATIATTYKFTFEVTIPQCAFRVNRPTVGGPGPVQQAVAYTNADSAGGPPVIRYISTDTAL